MWVVEHPESLQVAVDLVGLNLLGLVQSSIFLLPSMPYQASSLLIPGDKKGGGYMKQSADFSLRFLKQKLKSLEFTTP